MANRKSAKKTFSSGSTLILAVVLTSMLAIIGALFVMVSRVDRIATSAISENRELQYAVESIIARLSQELILDVPGIAGQEYYDYPDPCNAWLASLEPDANVNQPPYWRQISDVTGFLNERTKNYTGWRIEDVRADVVKDNEKISSEVLDPNGDLLPVSLLDPEVFANEVAADADGDGVSDSKWIQLDTTTSRGKPVFAAVRVVDNCGMLNVNTAYKFDPNVGPADANKVDGSSQMQINLLELSRRGSNGTLDEAANLLQSVRCGAEPNGITGLPAYEKNVVWRYNVPPVGKYTPFDIGDELELRNRFLLNNKNIETRIEASDSGRFWTWSFDHPSELDSPVEHTGIELEKWSYRTQHDIQGPNDIYSYRHIATTYNVDQTIGNKAVADGNVSPMININKPEWIRDPDPDRDEVIGLYKALVSSIDPNLDPDMLKMDPDVRWQIHEDYAQLTANIADFADNDNQVTVLNVNDVNYFGYEARPYISEIGMIISPYPETGRNYYALELYNPSNSKINLSEFSIELINREDPNISPLRVTFDNDDVIYPGDCFVVTNRILSFLPSDYDPAKYKQDPNLRFFDDWPIIDKSKPPVGRTFPHPSPSYKGPDKTKPVVPVYWTKTYDLLLKRRWIDTGKLDAEGKKIFTGIYVDKQYIYPPWAYPNSNRYFGRDARGWHIAYQTIVEDSPPKSSLGKINSIDPERFVDEGYIHKFSFLLPGLYGVANSKFVTVGDVPRVLIIGDSDDYTKPTVGERLMNIRNEARIRLDLRNPYYRNIFQYLTVFDPTSDLIDNDGDGLGIDTNGDGISQPAEEDPKERAVPGRININTAPWYVIAQLPWMTDAKAKAIVAYRDKLAEPVDYSIGRTNAVAYDNQVISLQTYTSVTGTEDVILREEPGFASIGELNFVVAPDLDLEPERMYEPSMLEKGIDLEAKKLLYRSQELGTMYADLGRDPNDKPCGFPDITTDFQYFDDQGVEHRYDGIVDDFEEKDVIFSRISNLVTVRSDLFTAYILVRIGPDGPQKRAVAILDRSNVTTGRDKVKLVALHYVPDPR